MPSITRRTCWLVAGFVLGATICARDAASPYPDLSGAAAPQVIAATTDNVVLQWDNAALQAIRVTKPGPPIVARALAIVHTAMYDAWAAYDDQAVGTRFGGALRRPGLERTLVSKNAAVSFAAYRALVDLFPTQTPAFIAPQWGRVVPFALTSGSQFRPPEVPNLYPFGGYRVQAEQILHYSARLTDTQKAIAEYWADGPHSELPPGHWMLFGQFVSRRDGHTLDRDVKMFFALANAVFDAGIVAWDCKRAYDYVRPVTAVHFLFAGKKVRAWAGPYRGTRVIDGADWEPYQPVTFVTPPFPEFISGHSAFSAAGAAVLKAFTGSDAFGATATVRAGSSKVEPGAVPARDVTLSWATFADAADQAGISRRYGGIHFVQGDLQGRSGGRLVGAQVWAKALTYFNGTATP